MNSITSLARHRARLLGLPVELVELDLDLALVEERLSIAYSRASDGCSPDEAPTLTWLIRELEDELDGLMAKRGRLVGGALLRAVPERGAHNHG